MVLDASSEQVVERLVQGASLWGLELDTRYRVLGATIEPAGSGWEALGEVADTSGVEGDRVQVLVFPVSVILGSLREQGEDVTTIRTFEADQLVAVAERLGGAPVDTPVLGRPEPRPGQWAPRWSLEGRSNAPDGRRRTVTWSVQEGPVALDVFARFDDLEVRSASGEVLIRA